MVHYALSDEFRREFNDTCLDVLVPQAKKGDFVVPVLRKTVVDADAMKWLSSFTRWALQQGLSADHTVLIASTHVKFILSSYQVSTWSDFIQDFFDYYKSDGDVRFVQWYWRRAANIHFTWFSYRELRACTNNFSELKLIRSGSEMEVYQGFVADDMLVAIKKCKDAKRRRSLDQILYEVLLHRSLPDSQYLVKLVGFSSHELDPLLVYEYVSGGSLEEHLHGKVGEKLTWDQRLTVAIDVATAITELHYNSKFPIYHRNVKSSNILLDSHRRAKLSDLSIAAAVSHEKQRTACHTKVKGSRGYTDPAYEKTGMITDTTDVYSFGVVLLELVTGLRAGELSRPKTFLPDLVNEMFSLDLLDEVVDPSVWCTCRDELDEQCRDCMKVFVENVVDLALRCCDVDPVKRPNIREVMHLLAQTQLEQRMSRIKISSPGKRVNRFKRWL